MANLWERFVGGGSSKQELSRRPTSVELNWILPNKLAVGPIPLDEQRQEALLNQGFKSLLTLCSESEGTPPSSLLRNVDWQRVPLPDSHSAESVAFSDLCRAVEQVNEYLQTSAPLYVHCVAGMERSPSVCVGYLYKYKNMQLWEALNWVKQTNPRTNILDSQLKAIQALR